MLLKKKFKGLFLCMTSRIGIIVRALSGIYKEYPDNIEMLIPKLDTLYLHTSTVFWPRIRV